ncbi:26S proteasome regulatory complex [Babesia gibsoni]|uniref:26S proteasome regulatory complex n=1 Tax=Babesia gibsoni TaxID=33632 RepID=A0AAD8LJJ6_BABGI|nr:26S proteasome regulatory complex [Babesia gibsoni]
MKAAAKENLSEADQAYKDDLDKLVQDLLDTKLDERLAEPILLQLVEHSTKDAGNITSVPKALQFLIDHKEALRTLYDEYLDLNGKPTYSLYLLLELMSFLATIATTEAEKPKDSEEHGEAKGLLLMLYKAEAGLVAEGLMIHPATPQYVRENITNRKINDWGNEYLKSFTNQIVRFFNQPGTRDIYDQMVRSADSMDVTLENRTAVLKRFDIHTVISEILKYVEAITDYFFQNGFEYDAIDLLIEVDLIESVRGKCGNDYDLITRVTSYIAAISNYAATHAEALRMLTVVYDILLEASRWSEALRIALKMDDKAKVKEVIFKTNNRNIRKQLVLICVQHGFRIQYSTEDADPSSALSEEEIDEINALATGEHISPLFLTLGAELDVLEPKSPKDVFKAYPYTQVSKRLVYHIMSLSKYVDMDSALGNLANTFVNAFVNCGFGTDHILNTAESEWLFQHHEFGILCAVASVGIISLWNVDEGLSKADKYDYSANPYVKAGTYAAYGLSSCGVIPEADPIAGLLMEKLESNDFSERLGAILGLSFAYAGTDRENIMMQLVPIAIADVYDYPIFCSSMAAVALGVIYLGTGRQEASEALIQRLLDLPDNNQHMSVKHLIACSLGLLHLGKMDAADVVIEALGAVDGVHGRIAEVMVEACAYAGSGDVLCIQRFLKCCTSRYTTTAKANKNGAEDAMDIDAPVNGEVNGTRGGNTNIKDTRKASKVAFNVADDQPEYRDGMVNECSIAILGIALVALGDPVGCEMLLRLMEQPLEYGSVYERRAVPLALALAYASSPTPQVVDMLSKLTHDNDYYVSVHAVFALGLIGAGTNNSRISILLQNLAKSNDRDGTMVFVIRLAAGLLHMGKGTTTISPIHSEGFLLRKVSLAGLLIVIVAALDIKETFSSAMPYTLLFIALAIRPRWLITVNPELEHVAVGCRVGNMVETIGTVGKQRRISGFQTHQTPVLVGVHERAELASEDHVACTTVLEGVVIVEKNEAEEME